MDKSIKPSTVTNSWFKRYRIVIIFAIMAVIVSICLQMIVYQSLTEESKNKYQNEVVKNLKESNDCNYVSWALSLKGRNFVDDIVKEAESRATELNCQ